jgi:hypothetical protein
MFFSTFRGQGLRSATCEPLLTSARLPPLPPEPEPNSTEDPLMFFLSFLFLLSRRPSGPRIDDVLMLDWGWVFLQRVGVEAMRVEFSIVQTARIWGDLVAGKLELI